MGLHLVERLREGAKGCVHLVRAARLRLKVGSSSGEHRLRVRSFLILYSSFVWFSSSPPSPVDVGLECRTTLNLCVVVVFFFFLYFCFLIYIFLVGLKGSPYPLRFIDLCGPSYLTSPIMKHLIFGEVNSTLTVTIDHNFLLLLD